MARSGGQRIGALVVGQFGHQARELAMDMRNAGQRLHPLMPNGPRAGLRLGAMVDDQRQVGVRLGKTRQHRQMPLRHQRIETQSKLGQHVQRLGPGRVDQPVGVVDVLQHRPDSLEGGVRGQSA